MSSRVVIVGAGFGGIAAAIELRRQGIEDVTILERAGGLGGTWRHNTYPGAACDVPSHLYSYSFAQRRDWTRLCSPQPEILAYAEAVAREHGVDRLVVGDTEVTACRWDETTATWTIETARGTSYTADAIVLATGQLHRPATPAIPGAESFAGKTMHSAEWDPQLDLRDQRVAVIGTGASAVQLVPEIAPLVRSLTVFQRSGNWFLPRRNRPYPRAWRAAVAHVPGLQRWRRAFVTHYGEALTAMIRHPRTLGRIGALRSALFMRAQLRDPELRRKAWPDYAFGCKRVLFSSAFLPALARPNVELTTDPIASIGPRGPVTASGRSIDVDTIIYATGFRTSEFVAPMEVAGAGGRTLREAWQDGASAHLGITVPGFPSMFLMYGPNTNTSGGSILVYLEAQASYLAQALALVGARGGAALDVRPEVAAASDRAVQGRFQGTAWTACDSWYRDGEGRIVANWPGYMREYVDQTAVLDPSAFTVVPAPVPATAAQPADSVST
ncbi:MAG: monooxygenase [Conexibacter sp.]|nr:monooxygenase [Conexibacter sp.]